MDRVLFIKLTSMGDLIHALPALTDLKREKPDLKVDWVIDESFAEVASWHPIVAQIFMSAHRRWKKNFLSSATREEVKRFIKSIRRTRYDLVLDGQNNHKSALVTALTRGIKAGLDRTSVREVGAYLAYKKKYHVPKAEHAVTRLRLLFAKAFDYIPPETAPDFGLDRSRFRKPALELPEEYLMFIHNASWETKLWPETYWQGLIERAASEGYYVLLPCGNQEEQARAMRLAKRSNRAIALPKLSLSEVAFVIERAKGAVCVDTGLSHLVGALEIPAISLYGSTDSGLIGAPGQKQIHLQSTFPCAPCYSKTCRYLGESTVKPACYQELSPQLVWEHLMDRLSKDSIS